MTLRKTMTFIVSLPERKEDRLVFLQKELDGIKAEATVWPAIKNIDGRLGLILTMQNLFNHCLNEGLTHVWVMEDDATFCDTPDILEDIEEQLPGDFDLFYLGGYMPLTPKELYSRNLIRVDKMYSTHSILYSRKGMSRALDLIEEMLSKGYVRPYDQMLVNGVQPGGNCYCSFPLLMKQRSGYSDIEKKEVDYTKYHEECFRERTVHLRAPSNG